MGEIFEIDLIGQACQDFAMSGEEFENDSEGRIVAWEFGLKKTLHSPLRLTIIVNRLKKPYRNPR
jgi:hypothetical protein